MAVLAGVPRLTFTAGERYTPMGALKAVGLYRKEEVTYALLMGVSGGAFRVAWTPEWTLHMCECAPEDLVAHGAAWLGLAAEPRVNDDLDEAWRRIAGSVDGGMPVLSCGLAGAPEFCVIAGYDATPRRLHVRGYFAGSETDAYAVTELRPWVGWNHLGLGKSPLVLLREGPAPDRGKLLEASLDRALRFAKVGRMNVHGTPTAFGRAAYDAWIDSLQNLDATGDLGLKAYAQAANLSALADARKTAIEYLRTLGAMRPEWANGLRRAAVHYAHLVSILSEAEHVIGFPLDDPAKAAERAAANLRDGNRREVLAKHLWSAQGEDDEALGWLDAALHGT